MSFSFFIPAASPPRFSAVVDAVAEPAWVCDDKDDGVDAWASGICFHPYVRGRSARGIEVSHEDGIFEVRIFTCSSRADIELALRTTNALARLGDATIMAEDGAVKMDRAEFGAAYGKAWIDEMVTSGPDGILAIVERDNHVVSLSGARREIHIGPRLVAELRRQHGDMTAGERLLARMVQVQNVDEQAYYPATALHVTPRDGTAADAFTMAAWAPDVAYVFPAVKFFALVTSHSGEILVPYERGPLVAGDKWTWLDEQNALVEATPASEWATLIARAREHSLRT